MSRIHQGNSQMKNILVLILLFSFPATGKCDFGSGFVVGLICADKTSGCPELERTNHSLLQENGLLKDKLDADYVQIVKLQQKIKQLQKQIGDNARGKK